MTKDTYNDFSFKREGLTKEEREKRKREFISNASNSSGTTFKHIFLNPFSLILFFIGLCSLLLSSFYKDGFITSLIIFIALVLSYILRFTSEFKARKEEKKLSALLHTKVRVKIDGEWKQLDSNEVVVGDLISLKAGDMVPFDIFSLDSSDLYISEAAITGESKVINANRVIRKGSTIISGSVVGAVLNLGDKQQVEKVKGKSTFEDGAASITKLLIKFMLVIIPAVFILSGVLRGNYLTALLFSLSIAIALVPELLPLVVTTCLWKGSRAMEKRETIVKNIDALQILGSIDTLCIDKTGTLTCDNITLEYYTDITGCESEKVLQYALLNSIYHSGENNLLDRAISERVTNKEKLIEGYTKISEHPFTYNKMYSSTLVKKADKKILIIKGHSREVIEQCAFVEYKGKVLPLDRSIETKTLDSEMAEEGMKVLAVAYKERSDEEAKDFIFLGYLAFFDPPKKSALNALSSLKELGVSVKVLSGDDRETTLSICKRLNIDTSNTLTGSDIDKLTEAEVERRIEEVSVFSELKPEQKELIVSLLQKNGHLTGFLGDGLNDLPAMLRADVSISVDSAVEAIRESAEVILLKKDLSVLRGAINEGRKAFVNMQKYINITAASNFGNILALASASILLPFFPMTSIQILLLNILYDILCLVLPSDNVSSEQIKQPLKWSAKKLSRFMLSFAPLTTLFDLLTFGLLFFVVCPSVFNESYTALSPLLKEDFITLFHSTWFIESMWSQVILLYLLRAPSLKAKPSIAFIVVTTIALALYTLLTTTSIGSIFGLTPLPLTLYLYLLIFMVIYLLLITIAKVIYLKKYKDLI